MGKPGRNVSLLQLVFITYFCVSGGCYGLEDAVRAGYPLFTLLGILILPWVWSLPVALMTAELSTAMPENGGVVVWAKRAFGPFWGFQTGYWTWVANLFDCALYPAMFVDYLQQLQGGALTQTANVSVRMLVIGLVTALNATGIAVVGKLSIVFALFVIAPFLVAAAAGSHLLDWAVLTATPEPLSSGNWGLYFSVILWNTCGWDRAGAVAGEIQNPRKTYPRALVLAVLVVIASYLWPVAVMASADRNWSVWRVGHFPVVAGMIAGDWLRLAMTVIGLVSALGLFNVILCTSSRALQALCGEDMLDLQQLARTDPRLHTPLRCILLHATGVACCSLLPFQTLVQIDVVMYSFALWVELASLLKLRISEPLMDRPYKLPLPAWGVALFFFPPACLGAVNVYYTTWLIKGVAGVAVVFGVFLFFLSWARANYKGRPAAYRSVPTEPEPFFSPDPSLVVSPPSHLSHRVVPLDPEAGAQYVAKEQ